MIFKKQHFYVAIFLFAILLIIWGVQFVVSYIPWNAVAVTIEDKACMYDDDCILLQPDCEDCHFDVINKVHSAKYRTAKANYCKKNPPKTQCDTIFVGTKRCVENICTLGAPE